jgi:hypothetical protein
VPFSPLRGLFATLSALRGRRILHPDGVTFRGTLVPDADGPLAGLVPPGRDSWPVFVRCSRGLGLPEPLPDMLGVALKLPDRHGDGADQDVLFTSSASGPLLDRLLLPGRGFFGRTFSTVLPYRLGTRHVLLGAWTVAPEGPGVGTDLDELRFAVRDRPVDWVVGVAPPLGWWRSAASLHLVEEVPETAAATLTFDPWHTGPPLEPAGLLNAVRARAYAGSRAGRGAAPDRAPDRDAATPPA